MKKKAVKFFEPGKSINWHKTDSQTKRRKAALAARRGDALATYHALDGLSKVTKDPETKRKSRSDAEYFRRLHNRKKLKKLVKR